MAATAVGAEPVSDVVADAASPPAAGSVAPDAAAVIATVADAAENAVVGTVVDSAAAVVVAPAQVAIAAVVPTPSTPPVAPGPGYFVDAVAGSDAAPGTFAQPWKTLSKLGSARLRAGDGIYLNCSSTWRESLSLTPTQLVEGSIIAGYGSCSASKATISGANDFSGGWTRSGDVWSRPVPSNTPKIARLFVQGEPMRIAQWPNADAGRNTRGFALTSATAAPAVASSALVVAGADLAALSGRDVVGAPMQIRHGGAQVDANVVSAYDSASGMLTLASAASFSIPANNGYVLQDKRWMVDAAGEFHHDQAGGMLYLWPTGAAAQAELNTALVEGAVRDVAFQVSNVARLAISDIAAVKARVTGIVVYNAASAVIRGVEASDNMRNGMQIATSSTSTGSSGTSVQSSAFSRNLVYGIHAFGLGNGLLKANTVRDTGTLAFVGQSQAGIWSGPGTVVENNVVRNSALSGIRFQGMGGSVVRNNLVADSCVRFSDCAGIYTWNGPKRADSSTNQRSRVEGNTVVRAPVDLEGADAATPKFNAGIYLDVFTEACTIVGNTVLDLPIGIYLHNASHNVIDSNTVALASRAGLWAYMNEPGSGDYLIGNVFSNNRIVQANAATGTFPATPVPTRSEAIWFWHQTLGSASITSGSNVFSGNDIVQLNDPGMTVAWLRGPTGEVHLSGAAWRQLNPLDPAPRSPQLFALHAFDLAPAELIANGGFDTGLGGWRSFFSNAMGTLGSVVHGSVPGCTANCAVFSAQTLNDTVISPSFRMKAGSMYRVAFQSSFVAAGTISKPGFVRDGATPGPITTGLTSSSGVSGIAGQTLRYEGFVSATSSDPGTLRLAVSQGTRVGFDAVSLREVTSLSLSRTTDWASYADAGALAVDVDCATLGWPAGCVASDANGSPVALPVTLQPYSARFFLRSDSAWRVR